MLCIHQIDHTQYEEIIDLIEIIEYFPIKIIRLIDKIINCEYQIKENITDLHDADEGYFLLKNNINMQLVKKNNYIENGYLYNSKQSKIDILYTWKVIPFSFNKYDTIEEYIQINEFPIDNMCANPNILIIGKQDKGKTWLTQKLLSVLNTNDEFIKNSLIIAQTEYVKSFYKQKFPDAVIIDDCMTDLFHELLLKCVYNVISNNTAQNGCIVIDDCLNQFGWDNNNHIREILLNIQFCDLPYILARQSSLELTTLNFDYIFLLKEDDDDDKEKLFQYYAHMFPDYNTFDKVFSDYSCLVIDNRVVSDTISDKVFWYDNV